MNLWLILLLIGVAAMVLGPIMLLQPNSTQRYQERLRKRAMELGLRVGMQSLPRQATDTEQPQVMPVYSLPPRKKPEGGDWLLVRSPYAHESHFLEFWVWQGQGRATEQSLAWLRQQLPSLPPSVAGVEHSSQGIGFYWSEAGGEKILLNLADILKAYPQGD